MQPSSFTMPNSHLNWGFNQESTKAFQMHNLNSISIADMEECKILSGNNCTRKFKKKKRITTFYTDKAKIYQTTPI